MKKLYIFILLFINIISLGCKNNNFQNNKENTDNKISIIWENENNSQSGNKDTQNWIQNKILILDEINKVVDAKQYTEAEAMYLDALKKEPKHAWLIKWLWNLYIQMWNIEKAKKYISEVEIKDIQGKIKNNIWIFDEIKKVVDAKQYTEAEAMYLDALKKEPKHVWLIKWLWNLYVLMWKIEEAKKYISEVEIKDIQDKIKSNIWILDEIKKVVDENKYTEAEAMYLDALKKEPKHVWLIKWLWNLYVLMWKIEEAKKYISEVEIKDIQDKIKSNIWILDEIKKVVDENKYTEAEAMYLDALKKEPKHTWLIKWLWNLYVQMWKIKEAKKYISDAEINNVIN